MNREQFGRLVAALRKEHIDEQGRRWTQQRLGQETGLGTLTIGKIERGQLTNLDGDLLVRLAEALLLTSGERREFFVAASGVSSERIPRSDSDPLAALNDLEEMLAAVPYPAFLVDCYYDLLAANAPWLTLMGAREEAESGGPRHENLLRRMFAAGSTAAQQLVDGEWLDIARLNIMHFREISLQHRHTPYFARLLGELLLLPQFRRLWYEVHFWDEDVRLRGDWLALAVPDIGRLRFVVSTVAAVTANGYLELCIYVPASPETMAACAALSDSASRVYRLAPWPEKPADIVQGEATASP